ncbi:MAG: T9SS type A sorting domain-containing protein [Calditrichia bacterium]
MFKTIQTGLLIIFNIILLTSAALSQVSVQQPINIQEGLNQGTIHGTVSPAFTNNGITNLFDGNPYTAAGVQGSSSISITLAFSDSAVFSASKVFFWNTVNWTLESADTENDLNNSAGSYQMLVNQQNAGPFSWDSLSFNDVTAKYVRLTVNAAQGSDIFIGEWELNNKLLLTSLYIYPNPPKVIPGTSLQLKVKALDENNDLHDYTLNEVLLWSTQNNSVASISEFGKLKGVANGNTQVTVSTLSGSISGSAPVSVVNDFTSIKDAPRTVKVALVIQDPVIDSTNNKRIHQLWGWGNPSQLISQIQDEFYMTSGGVINFQVVETHNDGALFTRIDSVLMTMDTLAYFYNPANNALYGHTPGKLQYLAENLNLVKFDYNYMVDYYDFDTKRNNGDIDEIWVYAPPFGGMYESQLMGPGAFWYNSPPLAHPGLNKLLSVMGWNYERGVAEALHSFGHRTESALVQAFGRWDVHNPDPNPWEIFTRIDMEFPDSAHVGNIHFPANGTSDYDYSNPSSVITYADNWKRYPYLLDQKRVISCTEWQCTHIGYMRWWLSHLPKYEGIYEGVLNNWWFYVVDFEEAVKKAQNTSMVGIEKNEYNILPAGYRLQQNYPNPFNPVTTIGFSIPRSRYIQIKVYDVLGKEVATVLEGKISGGEHRVLFDAGRLASGIYYYQLQAGQQKITRKMLLLK